MASLSHDQTGGRRCQFTPPAGGTRQTIRLGRLPAKEAEEFRGNVSTLEVCYGHTIPDEILAWALKLDPAHYNKLARAGLLPEGGQGIVEGFAGHTLGELVSDVKAGLKSKKPSTQSNYAVMLGHLLTRFGKDKLVAAITPRDADQCVDWIRNELKHSQATASREIKAFKMVFKKAIRWDWIAANPFGDITAGTQANASRQAFVKMETFRQVMAATPDLEFRCVLALSRIGGLRTPSETVGLRWEDVRWEEKLLLVRSPKTEGHEGKADRMVPLFPELGEVLAAWMAEAAEGSEFVVANSARKNWRTRLQRLIRRSGIKSWPRLFHNMRSSRQSELMATFPLVTVCQWLGNSPEVAAKHYLQDPDRDASFERATLAAPKVAQKAAHAEVILSAQERASENEKGQNAGENGGLTGSGDATQYPRRDSNKGGDSAGNSGGEEGSGAKSGARNDSRGNYRGLGGGEANSMDEGLARVAAAWARLSPQQRAATVVMVEAAAGGE